jgi:hypothetical protein
MKSRFRNGTGFARWRPSQGRQFRFSVGARRNAESIARPQCLADDVFAYMVK